MMHLDPFCEKSQRYDLLWNSTCAFIELIIACCTCINFSVSFMVRIRSLDDRQGTLQKEKKIDENKIYTVTTFFVGSQIYHSNLELFKFFLCSSFFNSIYSKIHSSKVFLLKVLKRDQYVADRVLNQKKQNVPVRVLLIVSNN